MFIARQPIFSKSLKVYGYELLFREDIESKSFGQATATKATATVLGGLFEIGIDRIADGKPAFVNFGYDLLLSDTLELLNPKSLVIEVLEDITVDDEVLNRLIFLKSKGYQIALDDFIEDYDLYPIVPLADIIKYDLIATPLDTIQMEVKRALQQNKILLAEKIETEEQFLMAKDMGFTLFQGYFFSKPNIIGKTNDNKSNKVQYARIINELKKDEPSYKTLAKVFETDVNLSYRLLKVISNRSDKDLIYSIKKALIYMGFKEIERWINILMLQDLSTNKPEELVKLSLVRAKLGELIADNSSFKKRKQEISMMCLFSNIDAILDETMDEALLEISVTDDIKESLICKRGILRPICELIYSYEKGNWDEVKVIAEEIGIDKKKLVQLYLSSLKWADEVLSTV
ncbi:EAL and HDOD domain-containing protein [Alkaliphilus hydrothermalis]|uniref:EAL and modified HD-GYP domain-containing signal transduction protein n=1 Tax=Alkaliphilus hydrothermalis TaxID=1482730 RepID=A0ABS2NMI2_9FIRM|nr:HDOD domain-containing protein [Alkaliphilus hydrothermalis]MBM7614152.1 EAL and modified HD-GYP domain-containing signal transduction protein [Alkaliphilus hydrothermalis]